MTNAQKWVAAFLLLFVVLFVLNYLTNKDNESNDQQYYNEETDNASSGEETDGLALIKATGCTSCHGAELDGTRMGPSLKNIAVNWNRNSLINYLRNPNSYSTDKRFEEYRSKFPNIVMPSYNNIDIKDLGKIADYLLQNE